MDFLLIIIIPFVGEVLLRGGTYSRRLIEWLLIIFYLFGVESILDTLPGLKQIGK